MSVMVGRRRAGVGVMVGVGEEVGVAVGVAVAVNVGLDVGLRVGVGGVVGTVPASWGKARGICHNATNRTVVTSKMASDTTR
jgi:hypothetical protein